MSNILPRLHGRKQLKAKHSLDEAVLEKAVQKIIINQTDYFTSQYERLTLHQQNVLKAISVENENIFNAGFTEKYNLNAISSVQRSVERLLAEGILARQQNTYLFTDPFFKMWLGTV